MPRVGRNRPPTTGKTTPKKPPKKPKAEKSQPKKPESWKPGRGRPLE